MMKECDIRPDDVFKRYLELSHLDAKAMIQEQEQFVTVDCPACHSDNKDFLFIKNDFLIQRCLSCSSIYCSPRPSKAQLNRFYSDSPSSKYWSEQFFPRVAEARRERLFRPKAKKIMEMCGQHNFSPTSICDVGAGHGMLLEEFDRITSNVTLYAVEPGKESAEVCRRKGFQVMETTVEGCTENKQVADLVTCFEVIEHVYDVRQFVAGIYNLVKPNGYCLVTGLGGDGFDIQVLGEKSKSIFPPHHLNFLSVQGLEGLFTEAGFTNVTVTTPGVLDVDIVKNTMSEEPLIRNAFVETLLQRGEEALQDFQNFLIKHQLSSHVWIFAQKGSSIE